MSNQPTNGREDPRYAALVAQYGNAARTPVNSSVIEYAHAPEKTGIAPGVQFLLGMLAPIAYAVMAGMTLSIVARVPELFFLLVWVHLIIFVAAVIYLRVKLKMRAFFAGVLTTVLGAPLGLGIVCGIICASL